MKACFRRAFQCGIWMTSTTASAWGPPPVPIQVGNDSGMQIEVWVDGAWRGSVVANQERNFTTLPGPHNVQATLADGTTLLSMSVVANPGQIAWVQVLPPTSIIHLANHGSVPLWVEIPGVSPFWSMPGAQVSVTVRYGRSVPVQTSIYGRNGLMQVGQLSATPCGGRPVTLEIGWVAPAPTTTVTMSNLEDHTVRVYIAGSEAAVIPPGQTRQWEVSPGRFQVTVVEHHDGVLYDSAVTFDPRRDHQLVAANGIGRLVAVR